MAKYSSSQRNVKVGVDIVPSVDQKGLNDLKNSLNNLSKMTLGDFARIHPEMDTSTLKKQFAEVNKDIDKMRDALSNSFNVKLGTLDLDKLNKEINKMDLNKISQSFQSMGSQGTKAFTQMAKEMTTVNFQFKQSTKWLKDFTDSLANTARWAVTSSIVNNITGSVQKAWDYSVKLDGALNDIRIVSGRSADDMERFAQQANNAAQALGKSTKDYAEAALIYYQQGDTDEVARAKADVTLKAANVTGQSTQEVSEQLTAVWNGYKVDAAEAETYVDKLAAVAATTASDLEELSTGMSKVASAANAMGVDVDQLNAQLATIVSVTRQAPESVGTALKTIYSRMTDIESGQDAETTLGTYTAEMAEFGVNVLDANGKLRDTGEVIEEIGGKWETFSREQQVALAQTIAGTRQYNNMLALFENFDQYNEALATSRDSMGTLQQQQDVYMESTQAHLEQLGTAWERVFDDLIDNEGMNNLIDLMTGATNTLGSFIESIGGSSGALTTFGIIATKVFKNQISEGLANIVTNTEKARQNFVNFTKAAEDNKALQSLFKAGLSTNKEEENSLAKKITDRNADMFGKYERGDITQEELQSLQEASNELAESEIKFQEWKDNAKKAIDDVFSYLRDENNQDFAEELKRQSPDGDFVNKIQENSKDNNIFQTEDDEGNKIDLENEEIFKTYQEDFNNFIDLYNEQLQKSKQIALEAGEASKNLFSSRGNEEERIKNLEKINKLQQQGDEYLDKLDNDDQRNGPIAFNLINDLDLLDAKLEQFGDETQDWGVEDAEELEKVIEHIVRELNTGTKEAEKFGQEVEGTFKASEGSNFSKEKDLGAEQQKKQQNYDLKKDSSDAKSYANSITDVTIGLQEMALAYQSITNLGSIWSNDDISAGEKILQTVLALTTALTSAASAMQSFKEANLKDTFTETSKKIGDMSENFGKKVLNSKDGGLLDTLFGNAQSRQEKMSFLDRLDKSASQTGEKIKGVWDKAGEGLSKLKDGTSGVGEKIKNLGSGFKSFAVGTDEAAAGAKVAMEGVEAGVTGVGEAAGGTTAMVGEMSTGLVGAGTIGAAALGAIAIAAVAIGVAIWAGVKAWNAEKEAAEKAEKTAEELRESHEELKQQVQETQQLWDGYKTAKQRLDECTQGTEEWRAALAETNTAAIELLNNLNNIDVDDLHELYSRDKDTGAITIDEDKLQSKVLDQQQKQLAASEMATAQGEYDAADKRAISDLTDAYRTDIVSAKKGEDDFVDQIHNNIDELKDLPIDEFKDKLVDMGLIFKSTSDEDLKDFQKQLNESANSIQLAKEKMDVISQTKVDEVLGDKYDSTTKALAGKEANSKVKEYADDYLKNTLQDGISVYAGKNNENVKQMLADLKEAGYNYDLAGGNAVLGWDDNRRFKFTDEEGKEVERSAEWVSQTVAASKALEELGTSAKKASKVIANIDKNSSDKDIAKGLKGYIESGNLDSLTEEELNKLKKDVGNDPAAYLQKVTGMSDKQLEKMLDDEDYENTFKKVIEDTDKGMQNFTKGLKKSVKTAVDDLNLKDVDFGSKKSIRDALKNAYKEEGQEGLDSLTDIFKGMDSKELEKVGSNLKDIDWSNITVDELKTKFSEMGVEVSASDEQLKQFIGTMRRTGTETQVAVEQLQESYAKAWDAVKDLQTGDTINKEQYEALGEDAQQYFQIMMDGTYKLIGNALDLKQAVKDSYLDKFAQQVEDLAKKNEQNAKKMISDEYDIEDLSKQQGKKTEGQFQYDPNQRALDPLQQKSFYDEDRRKDGSYELDLDTEGFNEQLRLLEEMGKKVDDYRTKLSTGTIDSSDVKKVTEEVEKLADKSDKAKESFKEINAESLAIQQQVAASAESVDELDHFKEKGAITDKGVYDERVYSLHEEERTEDLDTEEIENYSKYLQDIADESSEFADELSSGTDEAEENAEELATQILRMNDGVEQLAEGWEDWSDVLQHSSKTSEEYFEALTNTKKALADLLDTSEDYVSDDFIQQHMNEISQAAEGSGEAIDSLRQSLLQDIVLNLKLEDSSISNEEIWSRVQNMQSALNAAYPDGIQVGTSVDLNGIQVGSQSMIDYLNDMIADAHMTKDQVNAVLSQMGFQATFATEEQPTTYEVPVYTTYVRSHKTRDEDTGLKETGWVAQQETMTVQTGKQTLTGEYATFAMSTSAPGSEGGIPKITGLTKKANGSANNYSGKNAGGGSPKGSSGGGGNKGGGGNSSKPKDPDHMDPLEKEKDRYHDINIELKETQTQLDRLDKKKKKLFGQKLLDNINEQIGKLNEKISETNQKIGIARNEVGELQAKLGAKGVTFAADGDIANYAAAWQAQYNYVQSLINNYNGMSAEAQEGFKDTVEKAKKDFEEFEKNIKRYDELISDEIPGLEDDIQDAIDEKIDLQIEAFNMEIEIRLDLAEAERDWNEFKKKVIDGIDEDDILGNARAKLEDFWSYYKEDETGVVQRETAHLNDLLNQLRQIDATGTSSVYGDNKAQAMEDLKEYYEQLMEDLEGVVDLQEEVHEAYLDMMDEAQDKFDQQLDTFEQIADIIEHNMDLINLVYGEESYGALSGYYDRMEENYNKQVDFQRQQVVFWQEQMNTLEEGSEEWEQARDNWMDAVGDWRDTVNDAIENLQDKYLNTINDIFQRLNDHVTDGKGLEYVNEEWELINKNADEYLDTVNAMYGIQKLEKKYLDALDQTDSISAQRQIKELMDAELEDLRSRDKLTEYDIERAEKKYEIMLKQIALQEAQENKSKMRLRRDSQGNYTYQYVADDDAIGDLQDELSDMYNDLYNFDKDRYQQNLDSLYEIWAEFQEKMAEAAQINDPVARAERELLIKQQYEELINGIVDQNQQIRKNLYESAFQDLADLYNTDVENFNNMLDSEKEALMEGLIPYWDSGIQHMADVFAGEDGFLGVCRSAFEELKDATWNYENSLDELEDTAGVDFGEIADNIDDIIDATEELLWDNEDLIQSYRNQLNAIKEVISLMETLISKYNSATLAAKNAASAAYEYWQMENRAAAAAAQRNQEMVSGTVSRIQSLTNAINGSMNSGSSRSSGGGDGQLGLGDTATFNGSYYHDSFGSNPSGSLYSGVANGVVVDIINNNPYGIHIRSADGRYPDLGWVKRSQLSGYDTGGYTGEWNSKDGKLALLHEKELVLNKQDTKNLLSAIEIMRDITDSFNTTMLNKLKEITATKVDSNILSDTLEQNVHIDASFPNVESSREIEEALYNLVNMASMRIGRR